MTSALLEGRFFGRRLFFAALIAGAAMTTSATIANAASVTCPDERGLQRVYSVRIDLLDRTLGRHLGQLRDDLDGLTLAVASCTVGGVLDAVTGLATTSWSSGDPHPYALLGHPGGKWRRAEDARSEPLVDGARFWYPLLGRWTVAFGTDKV